MRLSAKVEERLMFVVGVCLGLPFFATCALIGGLLVLSVTLWLVSLFSADLALRLDALAFPEWPMHFGLVIPAVLGGATIVCGSRISHVLERRRAIADEIKPLSEIQIIEPPGPSRVERLAERSDKALERLYQRYFGWMDNAADQFRDAWNELPAIIKCLCCIVFGFLIGATTFWLTGVPFGKRPWLLIPSAVFAGWVAIYFAFIGLGLALVAIAIPLAIPIFAWIAAKHIIEWAERSLPRGLMIRYRQWAPRHGFAERPRMDWLTALVAIALIAISVAGLKACEHHQSRSENETEEAEAL
jgi:hypothetical protein